jgi:hypothetical protein
MAKTPTNSGMQFTVGTPQVPAWSPHRNTSPVYDDDKKVERQNVLLRNGTTVAIDDYDPDVHGPSVEETDDEYRMRMKSQPTGRPGGTMHAPTTIPNLQTFDSTLVPNLAAAPPTPPPVVLAGSPVMTTEEKNPNLVDAAALAPAGRVLSVEDARHYEEDQREAQSVVAERQSERQNERASKKAKRSAAATKADTHPTTK